MSYLIKDILNDHHKDAQWAQGNNAWTRLDKHGNMEKHGKYKKEPNSNFGAKTYTNWIETQRICCSLNRTTVNLIRLKKESVSSKVHHFKLSSQKKKGKKEWRKHKELMGHNPVD